MCEEIAAEMTRHGRMSFSSAPSMYILGYASAVQPKVSGETDADCRGDGAPSYFGLFYLDGWMFRGGAGLVLGKTEDAIHPSSNADENVP